ncbi:MAG: hypothetical protein LBD30_00755 [Verrucomicrobiales bacterium]|jgi:hypothetical protein|nr:hypothetical protein [Verrucomicrobiales bacterium]
MTHPVEIFTNNRMAARFWFFTSLCAMMALAVMPCLLVRAYRVPERAVVLNTATGSMVYAPVLGFMDADELHAYHARLATLTLLQTNPNGADFPELVDRLFLAGARRQVQQQFAASEDLFKNRQLRQKPEIAEIKILRRGGSVGGMAAVEAQVSGQLIRSGVNNGMAFTEPVNFAIRYALVRNPDLLNNNLFPLAVGTYQYQEQ